MKHLGSSHFGSSSRNICWKCSSIFPRLMLVLWLIFDGGNVTLSRSIWNNFHNLIILQNQNHSFRFNGQFEIQMLVSLYNYGIKNSILTFCFHKDVQTSKYRLNYNYESKFWEVKIGSYIFKGITFHIVPITYLATVIFLQKQTEIDDYYPPCLISLKFVSWNVHQTLKLLSSRWYSLFTTFTRFLLHTKISTTNFLC